MSTSPTLSCVNTYGQDVIWGTKATSDQQHTGKALAINPGVDTEIIRDLALAIAQISGSRNRGADCFPGTAEHSLGAPSQHPKAAAIRATRHTLTCPDRNQYTAWHILDEHLQGRREDSQELGSPTRPMRKKCAPRARATLASGSEAGLALGPQGNQSPCLRKAAIPGHPGAQPHPWFCSFP